MEKSNLLKVRTKLSNKNIKKNIIINKSNPNIKIKNLNNTKNSENEFLIINKDNISYQYIGYLHDGGYIEISENDCIFLEDDFNMDKMKYFVFILSLLFISIFCRSEASNMDEKLDTSDNNPIAFCLRQRNGFTDQKILEFLIAIQDPEKAVALFPIDGKLSRCVQKRIEEVAIQKYII